MEHDRFRVVVRGPADRQARRGQVAAGVGRVAVAVDGVGVLSCSGTATAYSVVSPRGTHRVT
ncbi:hypothetical protein ACSDR0_10395 [Streptosporangium sp. G11]|uniref:hypothetical protein n=1 Tax=Streptosporangium sp. G11 TaxID=3436926 RepID=UPI003EBEC7F7